MKKTLVNLLVVTMLILMIAPGVSAKSVDNNISKEDNLQSSLSEKLIKTVDPHIKVEDKSFKLSNVSELKTKLSKSELDLVEKNLSEMNALLKKNPDIVKVNGENAFQVEMTDEELKEKTAELGYDYDLNASVDTSHLNKDDENQLFAKNGKNKIKVHAWGLQVWLSKTSVGNILGGGITAAGLFWAL